MMQRANCISEYFFTLRYCVTYYAKGLAKPYPTECSSMGLNFSHLITLLKSFFFLTRGSQLDMQFVTKKNKKPTPT